MKIKALVEKTNDLNLDMWDLTTFAEKNLKDKEQLAKFYYYWIGSNIKYDHKSLKEKDNGTITLEEYRNRQSETEVYKNRKGVCAGYSKLYNWFLDWADIESVYISGHIRDKRNHYVEIDDDDDFRHAWNAIKLNGKWILVDTTWGTSNNSETSDYYFDIKPEFAIITHFPKDKKWQLLKKPLSLEEFNNSKFISPIWFHSGFSDIPKLKADKDNYYLIYQKNTKNWTVNLLFSTDNLNFKPIENITKINQEGKIFLKFPKKQIPEHIYFKINLQKKENLKIEYYEDVINFKI